EVEKPGWPVSARHLSSPIRQPAFVICHLPFAICFFCFPIPHSPFQNPQYLEIQPEPPHPKSRSLRPCSFVRDKLVIQDRDQRISPRQCETRVPGTPCLTPKNQAWCPRN